MTGATATDQPTDAWRGLGVVDDLLWYGQATPTPGRPPVCFDPDALVVVDEAGRETRLRWDDHVAADRSRPGAWQWLLHGLAPTRTDLAGVWLVAGRFGWTGQTRRWARGGPYHAAVLHILDACDGPAPVWAPAHGNGRGDGHRDAGDGNGAGHGDASEVTVDLVAGRGRGQVLWEEIPALAAYLAATPAARAGLADPDRTGTLVSQLRARTWRRPRPPIEPLLGDRLDLHVAVRAVLQQRVPRRFGGRLVHGEPAPPAGELVAEVMDGLPPRVRPRISPERIARHVERHLAVGRWPFDLLLPEPSA